MALATVSSSAGSPPCTSCTSILKPPVVPMPRTGGGATEMMKASWMPANCVFNVLISACALWPFAARCLKSSKGVNTTAALGAVVKVAPSRPTMGTAWAMPGVDRTIFVTLRATSSVRASEAPGGSWMMLIR